MAEERIKGRKKDQSGRAEPGEAGLRQDELSPEQLESVAGGAAFQEESQKKKTTG